MHECLAHTLGTCGQLILVTPLPHISPGKHNIPPHLGVLIVPVFDAVAGNEHPDRASIASADHEGVFDSTIVFTVTEF
jgi:hypothetical protein